MKSIEKIYHYCNMLKKVACDVDADETGGMIIIDSDEWMNRMIMRFGVDTFKKDIAYQIQYLEDDIAFKEEAIMKLKCLELLKLNSDDEE